MSALAELNSITNDYFMIKDRSAVDIYTETSFLLDYYLKQKKGIHERPSGGKKIVIPIEFDGNKAGFFTRGGTLDSTKVETVTQVEFQWKNAFGNGIIYATDGWQNSGPEAKVDLVVTQAKGAQKAISKVLATSLYTGLEGDDENLTGLNSLTSETTDANYGGYSEDDIVAEDGTKPWEGKTDSTTAALTLPNIRTGRTEAAYGQGKQTRPDLMATTEANFDVIMNILQVQQRFTSTESEPVKAGFQGVNFEGMDIFPDRYCPASNAFLLSSHHTGFVVHKNVNFKRTPWEKIQGSAGDKTMKILWSGNFVCNNRRANYRFSTIS